MNIIVVDGFKMISENEGEILLVESDRLHEYLDYAEQKGIKKISLQGYHGFDIVQTDFFEKYNFFTFVWINSDLKEIDISGIKFLHRLDHLRMNNKDQGVDFSNFPHLGYASMYWNRNLVNLHTCRKLKSLKLRKYNPQSKSLYELSVLPELSSLALIQSTIVSIDGIEKLKELTQFEADYVSKLENADELAALAESLNSLSLSNCKKLKDINFLSTLTKLKTLKLVDCGSLPNLDFLKSLPSLEFFTFVGTDVEDGDLSILAERKIKFVSFDDKRHFSHKMKQINPDFCWKAN